MKIKEIYVEAKKSKKFQTYTAGFTAEINAGDDVKLCIRDLQNDARIAVLEQIAKDEPKEENPYVN